MKEPAVLRSQQQRQFYLLPDPSTQGSLILQTALYPRLLQRLRENDLNPRGAGSGRV